MPLSPHRGEFQDFVNLQRNFPTTPQYENDHNYLDSAPLSPFFRASPKVTPSRYPTPRSSSLPPPKYSPNVNMSNELDDIHGNPNHGGPNPSMNRGGVETILRASASTDFDGHGVGQPHEGEDPGTHISPARESQRNAKLSIVSPPEDEGPRRGPPPSHMHPAGYDAPSGMCFFLCMCLVQNGSFIFLFLRSFFPRFKFIVPDSPYGHGPSGYYQGPPGAPQYPPSSYQYPHRPKAEDPDRDRYAAPPPYYPPPYGYGYERGGYEGEGYGKRQRTGEDAVKSEPEREGEPPRYPPPQGPPRPPYYDRPGPGGYNYHYYRPSVSESFESGSEGGSKRTPRRPGPPPVSKAPSYPPPPSPSRYGAGADSSAASYPGARRTQGGGSDYSYNNSAIYSHSPRPPPQHGGPPPYGSSYPPPRYEEGAGPPPGHPPPPPPHAHDPYYRDPRAGSYGPPPPYYEGGHPPEGGDPYRMGPQSASPDGGHPLLHDDKISTPRRSKSGAEHGPSSPKDGGSPNKPKPSTTAQAAIAAGMTEPPSAKEVDFDINDPPTQPITPPSARPVCTQSSEVNIHDVLCGRGGGTNTQIGNRRFRSLVQEFQPTYLLCRRKEKPLIARTIVLIVRNRGGRFLKKHEDEGTFYEVGDEKAEAKTSQALREGLDVRASRSSIDGKKKPSRSRKKKSPKKSPDRRVDEGAPPGESARRDGPPPPPHDYMYPPPPPPYGYYGYDPYYPPAYGGPGYGPAPYASPSRKRPRGPPNEAPYEYPSYPPSSPYKSYPYQYPEHYPPGGRGPPPPGPDQGREEDNPMWEEDFSPPRSAVKRQDEH